MYHIIYQTESGPQTEFEKEYWNERLLSSVGKTIFYDNAKLSLVDDKAIIVYSTNKYSISSSFEKYLRKFKAPILIHLSNEGQNHNAKYYKHAKAVLRTASWNPATAFNNVFTLPLGFQSGYLNKNNSFNQDRDLIWAFAGTIKQDRMQMLACLEDIKPHWYFKSSEWGSSDMKSTADLIEIYKRAIFAPTPFGNINFECFRTMEALEWGCIPVATEFLGRDCYRYVYGDHPFIVGKDWKDAASQMKQLLMSPDVLKAKQKEVWNWYNAFKEELVSDVRIIVEGDFSSIKGVQFKYQKASKRDWILRWRFFKHFTLDVYLGRLFGKVKKANN